MIARYEEFDMPYARIDGRELVLRITRPAGQGAGPFPVLLDFHGGAWTHFDHRVDLACGAQKAEGHFGVDVAYMINKRFGVGGLARYTRGSVELAGASDKLTVGGFQVGAGLRARF